MKCRTPFCDNEAEKGGLCGLCYFIEFDIDALEREIEEEDNPDEVLNYPFSGKED